jgi:PAS domain S-box-containing protein
MTAAATEALIEQNADGIITEWSAEAELLFGWTRVDAIGKPSSILVPERNRARYAAAWRAMLAGRDGRVLKREITVVERSGREFLARFRASIANHHGAGDINDVRIVARLTEVTAEARVAQVATAFQNHDRYRAILDQIEDGCCVVDLKGHFIFVNDAFCRIFGFEKKDVLGSHFKTTMGPERSSQLRDIYMRVYNTGEPVKAFRLEVTPKNAATRYVEQTISLERDAQGHPAGFLAITRDCTARHEAEEAVARSREAAEAANRAKSEFLANMSHEIRTPMNGIIGMTALALGTELTPDQADCLNSVRTSAESLLTILNDVLDFSKIESRKLELESVPMRLGEVIGDALKPLSIRAGEKGLELAWAIAPDAPPQIVGDPVRLKQIITNLVGNAIKFTDRGHVRVSVREDTRGDGCTKLRFSVSDTGIGIAADKHGAIFEAFRQADGSTTRRFGGTGLGLTISSTLVQLMGGRIWVDSAPGTGSTFHFTAAFGLAEGAMAESDDIRKIPMPQATSADPGAAPQPAPLAPPSRAMRVLVAEDNVVNQRVAGGLLTRRGHTVTIATNGLEAVDAIDRGTFDVVLMDVQMPEMGGFEATAAIRARERERGGHLRIVAMTAHAMNGDRERCIAAGMDGYIPKPLDPRLLYTVVEQDPAHPHTAAGAVDRPALLERLGGDEQLLSDVIQIFLDDCPTRLEAIRAAVSERHAERIRKEAHALKGAAGNLSATGLFEAAQTLERIGAENRLEAAEAGWRLVSVEAARTLDALRRFELHS